MTPAPSSTSPRGMARPKTFHFPSAQPWAGSSPVLGSCASASRFFSPTTAFRSTRDCRCAPTPNTVMPAASIMPTTPGVFMASATASGIVPSAYPFITNLRIWADSSTVGLPPR
ncbi:hypothetical protein D3C72_1726620 [compost metagenome]